MAGGRCANQRSAISGTRCIRFCSGVNRAANSLTVARAAQTPAWPDSDEIWKRNPFPQEKRGWWRLVLSALWKESRVNPARNVPATPGAPFRRPESETLVLPSYCAVTMLAESIPAGPAWLRAGTASRMVAASDPGPRRRGLATMSVCRGLYYRVNGVGGECCSMQSQRSRLALHLNAQIVLCLGPGGPRLI